MTDHIRRQLGLQLRRIRLARGWTLRMAADSSDGLFAATSIAGYERGERSISLERYIELCRLYDVPPNRLLAATERAASDRAPSVVDIGLLHRLQESYRPMVAGFIGQVVARRERPVVDNVTLRAQDVQILASAAGVTPDELIDRLAPRGA